MKQYHYTYYSYEEFGRGYIGKRSCKCLPEEDVKYFGSYTDKTFKPTQKIILETYNTAEDLAKAEEILHAFYDVTPNPHFANKHNANGKFHNKWDNFTPEQKNKINKRRSECTKKYYASLTPEQRSEISKQRSERIRKYYASLTPEQRSERITKALLNKTPEQRSEIRKQRSESVKEHLANLTPEQRSERIRKCIAGMTPEKRSEAAKKRIANTTPEQRSESVKKGWENMNPEQRSERARKRWENMNPEQRSEITRKGRESITPEKRTEIARNLNDVKFRCTETGFITNAGALSKYQKARGIDTSNRIRIS